MTRPTTELPSPAALVAEAIAIGRDVTSGDGAIMRARLLLDIAHELRVASDERRREELAGKVAADVLAKALGRPRRSPVKERRSAIDILTDMREGGDLFGDAEALARLGRVGADVFAKRNADRMFGYERGQSAPPCSRQVELARDAQAAGALKTDAQWSLLKEILDREAEAYAWAPAGSGDAGDLADVAQGEAAESDPLEPFPLRVPELAETQRFTLDEPVSFSFPTDWVQGDESTCRFCQTPVILDVASLPQQTYGNGGDALLWRHKYTGQAVCATPLTAEQIENLSAPAHTFATPATVRKDLATGGTLYGGGGPEAVV